MPSSDGPHPLDTRFAQELARQRQAFGLPGAVRDGAEHLIHGLLGLLFPPFSAECAADARAIQREWTRLRLDLEGLLLAVQDCCPGPAEAVADALGRQLPEISAALWDDARAIERADPAAESLDEVLVAYPGFLAIAVYRLAHALAGQGVRILPRLFSETAHRLTGIDIHPGAQIGRRFVMDHGTGIVIGATSVIGDDVTLYQGVTLGALQVDKSLAGAKRHPTLGDRVVVYSNATILGGSTVVGADSIVGGNVWLTESVLPGSVVTRKSEVRVRTPGSPFESFDWSI